MDEYESILHLPQLDLILEVLTMVRIALQIPMHSRSRHTVTNRYELHRCRITSYLLICLLLRLISQNHGYIPPFFEVLHYYHYYHHHYHHRHHYDDHHYYNHCHAFLHHGRKCLSPCVRRQPGHFHCRCARHNDGEQVPKHLTRFVDVDWPRDSTAGITAVRLLCSIGQQLSDASSVPPAPTSSCITWS